MELSTIIQLGMWYIIGVAVSFILLEINKPINSFDKEYQDKVAFSYFKSALFSWFFVGFVLIWNFINLIFYRENE